MCREVDLGEGIRYTLFGLFDGHGGNGTSMKIAMELPLIIHQNLQEMLPLITGKEVYFNCFVLDNRYHIIL